LGDHFTCATTDERHLDGTVVPARFAVLLLALSRDVDGVTVELAEFFGPGLQERRLVRARDDAVVLILDHDVPKECLDEADLLLHVLQTGAHLSGTGSHRNLSACRTAAFRQLDRHHSPSSVPMSTFTLNTSRSGSCTVTPGTISPVSAS